MSYISKGYFTKKEAKDRKVAALLLKAIETGSRVKVGGETTEILPACMTPEMIRGEKETPE